MATSVFEKCLILRWYNNVPSQTFFFLDMCVIMLALPLFFKKSRGYQCSSHYLFATTRVFEVIVLCKEGKTRRPEAGLRER